MITVKLFGIMRIESGIKELTLDVSNVKELYKAICAQTDRITEKELTGCMVLINGVQGNKRSKLQDGDVITLMSPVAGG